MDKIFNSPEEVIEANICGGEKKVSLPLPKMILLGIMAGAFIALGAATSSTAAHAVTNVGLSRFVAGAIFPVGLMLITFIGGELFTGNCLTSMGAMDHRFSWGKVVRDLCIIWLSNLVGALIIVALTYFSGNLDYSAGLLGAYSIKVALGKATITPIKGIASGILCNILVCAAILMGAASKDISGKVWAIFFPIMAFVVGGFEHCVANMFYIPMGMLAATNDTYVAKAAEAYGITADQLANLSVAGFFANQIPVTIGNILGGMIFVGLPCYLAHCKKKQA
ncbi:formate/nitrite transporter [Pseudobutyrivibrio sp. C4]|uniref:formate/nitrite transporter family protein n=1 Tax=Pseudobutyrivibrio sp. C4 TaxID=1520803 RepID=UPI0008B8E2A2|nr:formate/nitrite transporter family protein [Pseudobutyrivibrio sp. C4]SES95924.1 formate/nitrite transporter [Pseudobutyrivibrio sp. C4]